MFTSLFAVAMVHAMSAKPEAIPTWDTDYRHARAIAAKEQKPLAVVVGNVPHRSDRDFGSIRQHHGYVGWSEGHAVRW